MDIAGARTDSSYLGQRRNAATSHLLSMYLSRVAIGTDNEARSEYLSGFGKLVKCPRTALEYQARELKVLLDEEVKSANEMKVV